MKRNIFKKFASFTRLHRFAKQFGQETKITKIKINKRLVKSLTMATAIVLPLVLGFSVQSKPVKAEAKQARVVTAMPLDLKQNVLFAHRSSKANIVVGDSNADKEAKEKAHRTYVASVPTVSTADYGEPSLEEKRAVYQQVAAKYGIPWQLLEAVHQIESGKRWNQPRRSGAGATGPMQFLPSTWRSYGQDGNGDGSADIMNPYDALHGAANYLAANGANRGDIDNALFRYNHSSAYVAKVKSIMNSI